MAAIQRCSVGRTQLLASALAARHSRSGSTPGQQLQYRAREACHAHVRCSEKWERSARSASTVQTPSNLRRSMRAGQGRSQHRHMASELQLHVLGALAYADLHYWRISSSQPNEGERRLGGLWYKDARTCPSAAMSAAVQRCGGTLFTLVIQAPTCGQDTALGLELYGTGCALLY